MPICNGIRRYRNLMMKQCRLQQQVKAEGREHLRVTSVTKGNHQRKRKKFRPEHNKQRFRKNFAALLEEEMLSRKTTNIKESPYMAARAPEPKIPARHFCAICGFYSKYTCIRCGTRYCSIKCRDVHNDTRCLKWTV